MFVSKDLEDVIWLHVPAARSEIDDFQDNNSECLTSGESDSEGEFDDHSEAHSSLRFNAMKKEGEVREYSLGEMTDLQSRLMLVTGKADAGRESIERFTSVRKTFLYRYAVNHFKHFIVISVPFFEYEIYL